MTVEPEAPATPAVPKKRPPRFLSYQEVEIDIDPEDLERAGWVHVGDAAGAVTSTDRLERLILDRHSGEHEGPFRWCNDPICEGPEWLS